MRQSSNEFIESAVLPSHGNEGRVRDTLVAENMIRILAFRAHSIYMQFPKTYYELFELALKEMTSAERLVVLERWAVIVTQSTDGPLCQKKGWLLISTACKISQSLALSSKIIPGVLRRSLKHMLESRTALALLVFGHSRIIFLDELRKSLGGLSISPTSRMSLSMILFIRKVHLSQPRQIFGM